MYLLGGSNVRECIETPAALQRPLKAATGVSTTVIDLGSSDQHFGETMAVIDNLPKGPGVVVISVNQSRFAYSPTVVDQQIQGFTMLMQSTALWRFSLDRQGHAPKDSIAAGVRAYYADWRKRNAAALAAGRRPWHVYQNHRYTAALSAARKQAQVTRWLTGKGAAGGDFSRYHAYDAALLGATIKLARAKGLSVVLMEAPASGAVIGRSFDKYRAVYRPACADLAAADGARYVDPNRAAGLTDADFHDITHLLAPGRAKWTRALAAALAPTVASAASPSPSP